MDFSKIDPSKALSALVDKMQNWLNDLVLLLPNLVIAGVTFFVAVLIARLVGNLVRKTMDRATSFTTLNNLAATAARTAVIAGGLFVALGVLGLDKTVTSLLAGAGVIGLALAFAFQDIAGNFMSGIILAVRRPFKVGDVVETNDHFGVIEEINLRSTLVRTTQGQIVIIPNSMVLQNAMKNYSKIGQRRVDLSCGVAYGDDLELAERTALGSMEKMDIINKDKPVDLYFTEFGDSSINFKLRFWVNFSKPSDFMKARSQAIKTLKVAFDEAGLTIPFPIRTLDFGVVGGVNLNEVMPQKFYKNGSQKTSNGQVPVVNN